MVVDFQEHEKIKECIGVSPFKYVRLTYNGVVLAGWNPVKINKIDFYESKIIPYLENETTSAGIYSLEGRNTGKSTPIELCQISKAGTVNKNFTPQIHISEQDQKNKANFNLVTENAELKYKCLYLEKEIEELKKINAELWEQIGEMNYEEDEEEEIPVAPVLSDGQKMLMDLAAPLIPGIQAFALNFLNKYIDPPNNEQQRGAGN